MFSWAGEREALISQIEHKAAALRKSGECEKWLGHACPFICATAASVNGPLLEYLAHSISYEDAECVDLFRKGMPDKPLKFLYCGWSFVSGACIYSGDMALVEMQ